MSGHASTPKSPASSETARQRCSARRLCLDVGDRYFVYAFAQGHLDAVRDYSTHAIPENLHLHLSTLENGISTPRAAKYQLIQLALY